MDFQLAPQTIFMNIDWIERENGAHFSHKARRDYFGNVYALVKDLFIGGAYSRKVEAFTSWNVMGEKSYVIQVTRTFGLFADKVGYMLKGQGGTPAEAKRNLDALIEEFQVYTQVDLVRMSLDFPSLVFPLDADFSTLSVYTNEVPDGFLHCYILKSPAYVEMVL